MVHAGATVGRNMELLDMNELRYFLQRAGELILISVIVFFIYALVWYA